MGWALGVLQLRLLTCKGKDHAAPVVSVVPLVVVATACGGVFVGGGESCCGGGGGEEEEVAVAEATCALL